MTIAGTRKNRKSSRFARLSAPTGRGLPKRNAARAGDAARAEYDSYPTVKLPASSVFKC